MTVDAVGLLRRLVAIDSTSSRPNGPVLDLLEAALRPLGFEARRMVWDDANGVRKENLIARRGPEVPGGLALVGHSDCVPFEAAWAGALTGEIRDGRLYGRGAADTKAFLAAAVAAAARTSEPLVLIATADEEVGCLGAKRLLEEGRVRPAAAIIGEPTGLTPVHAHKGYCLAEIVITGREAHSAYPELGASAVLAAGRVLAALEALQEQLTADRDPVFSPPFTTLNVGLIQGGRAKNVIPGQCTLTLEWRPIPAQDGRHVLGLVEAACAGIAAAAGVEIAVRPSRLDAGVKVPADTPLVRFVAELAGKPAGTIPFGTELPYLVALGAEACVFGAGDIRVAHRTDELVPLDELRTAEDVLVRAIGRFHGAR